MTVAGITAERISSLQLREAVAVFSRVSRLTLVHLQVGRSPVPEESCSGWPDVCARFGGSLRNLSVTGALPSAVWRSCPHLVAVSLRQWTPMGPNEISAMATIAALPCLRSLDLAGSSLTSLEGLRGSLLEALDVSDCGSLTTLAGVEGLPCLVQLRAQRAAITALGAVDRLQRLRSLDVAGCGLLGNVEVLARTSPSLEALDVSGLDRGVSLLPLRHCRQLRVLRCCGSGSGADVSAVLAHLPALEVLECREALAIFSSLSGCHRLRILTARVTPATATHRHTPSLVEVPPLPALEVFACAATACLTSVASLQACRCLRRVDVSMTSLRSLDGLDGLAVLDTLIASDTPVTSLGPLRRCRALREVVVVRCGAVRSLQALAGLPRLAVVMCGGTGVTSLAPLAECPSLEHVSVAGCPLLRSLAGLWRLPALAVVDAEGSAIESVEALWEAAATAPPAPALRHVNVRACAGLPTEAIDALRTRYPSAWIQT